MRTLTQTIGLLSLLTLTTLPLLSNSQSIRQNPDNPQDGILVRGIIVDGDTLPMITLDAVCIVSEMTFKNKRDKEKWTVLKYNVKKAYPYAIIASARLREYENVLKSLPSESARETYMEIAEKQLKNEFEAQLKGLSMNQGRILIKLIDRETGRTSYDLVKKLRGTFSAWMWQGMARLFGSNLKSEYDAKGEDRLIEVAISQIESGSF